MATLAALSVGSTVLAGLHGDAGGGDADGGCGFALLSLWLVGTLPFAMATWRTVQTGVLVLPRVSGPTEGLLLLCCTHATAAALGARAAWAAPPLASIQLPPSLLLLLSSQRRPAAAAAVLRLRRCHAYGAVGVAAAVLDAALHARAALSPPAGRPWQLRRAAALAQLLPYGALVACAAAWAALSPDRVAATRPFPFLLGVLAPQFAHLMGRLILHHLSGGEGGPPALARPCWAALAPLPLAVLNAARGGALRRARSAGGGSGGIAAWPPAVPELAAVALASLWGWAVYGRFAARLAADLCALLRVRCFSLARPRAAGG